MLKRLGRDVAIYGGVDFVFRVAQFAAIPVYAHLLSVADFGLMALLVVTMNLLAALAALGIGIAVQRFYFEPENAGGADRRTLVSTAFVQLLCTAALIVGGALLIAWQFRAALAVDYGITWLLVLVALATVLPDQLAQFTLDTSRVQFAPLKFCVIAVVKNHLGLALGLALLAWAGMGLLGFFLGQLVASTLAFLVGLWLVRSDFGARPSRPAARSLFLFGYPFVFTTAAYWVFGSMDRWLLVEMSDAAEVGLFSIAFKFGAAISFVIAAFHQAWIPHAMKMMREDPAYRQVYGTVFSAWLFLLGLMALAIALFAREILVLLTPRDYWPAAPTLALAAVALAISGSTQITAIGVTLEKRTLLLALGAWAAAGLNIALNLLLIPRLGAQGSALATVGAYTLLTLFFLIATQKLHPIVLQKGRLLYGCALIAAAAAAPYLFPTVGLTAGSVALKLLILAAAVAGAATIGIIDVARLHAALRRRIGLRTA